MSQQQIPLPPLALPRTAIVGAHAFDNDKLGRKELAERLTGYIDRLREGAVLAIDAPWGEGKTWFGRNWAKYLGEQGHKIVYIDAFEQDYVEDPFLLIASEISQILDDGQGSAGGLRGKAAGVMKAILPLGTKALLNLTGRIAIGSADLAGEFKEAAEAARDGVSDAAEKWIEKKIENYGQEKASLKHFHEELTGFAAVQEKPVILFIDELDRCRPDFAVKLIERVKHFFDVPGLVFILLLNRKQLEQSVKGVYGQNTDATAYLGKFVNFFFQLPKRKSLKLIANNHVNAYITHTLTRYNFTIESRSCDFGETLGFMAKAYNFSLRDIEKSIALFAFSQPFTAQTHILAYMIVLKINSPELFKKLKDGDPSAHTEAKSRIEKLIGDLNASRIGVPQFLTLILEIHSATISGFNNISEELQRYLSKMWMFSVKEDQIFSYFAEKLDISLED